MGDVEFDPCDLQYDYRGAMGEYDDEEDEDDTSYHHISEVYETHHKLKTVRDLEGVVVASEMGIEEDDMLDPDAFEDMVGEEEYEGYMGNSVRALPSGLCLGLINTYFCRAHQRLTGIALV